MKLSSEKLNQLGIFFDNTYIPNNLPGFSILVQQDNNEVYYYQSGEVDVNRERKLNRESIFRIYSMTKPITSMSIMMLLCLLYTSPSPRDRG